MGEIELRKLMDIFSYERYALQNSRSDTSYIYPIIMPIEGCKYKKAEGMGEFFCQEMYPLMEKNDHVKYGIEEVMANLARATHGLTKYEINSPYKFHRPVPSARGIHPCELYFWCENEVKRYNPIDNTFDILWESEGKENDFSIVIAADDWRLAKYYGDFAYVLGALDAGHIIGQLSVLAMKSGCDMEVICSKAQNAGGNNVATYFEEQDLVVYASVIIRNKKEKKKSIQEYQLCGKRKLSYRDKVEKLCYREVLIGLKQMNKICEKPDQHILFEKKEEHNYKKKKNSIDEILRKRTSAHSHIGLMSIGSVRDLENKLSWMIEEMEVYLRKVGMLSYINIYLFMNEECDKIEKGYYKINFTEKCLQIVKKNTNAREEWFRIIHDSHEFLNVQGIPLVFLVSVNVRELLKKYENRLIDTMYIYSGEIGQILSLLATRYNLFCRPIKNICEKKLEEVLKIDSEEERITYVMLVGQENISQQKLEMNSFEGGNWNE